MEIEKKKEGSKRRVQAEKHVTRPGRKPPWQASGGLTERTIRVLARGKEK